MTNNYIKPLEILTGGNGSGPRVSKHAEKCSLDHKHQKATEHRILPTTTFYCIKKSQL
jgi:hypothetical protein